MKGLVYLAGPITGLEYNGATDWRNYAAQRMEGYAVSLSPMRYKNSLKYQGKIANTQYEERLLTDSGITARDRFDCQRSDLILFNFLDAKTASIGSCIEIGWIDAFRKPSIAVLPKGSIHDHPMIRNIIPYIVSTLEEAMLLVKHIFDTESSVAQSLFSLDSVVDLPLPPWMIPEPAQRSFNFDGNPSEAI